MTEGDPQRDPGLPQGEDPDGLTSHNGVLQHLEDLAARYGFGCFAVLTLPASNQEHLQENLVVSNLRSKFIRAYDALRPFKTAPLVRPPADLDGTLPMAPGRRGDPADGRHERGAQAVFRAAVRARRRHPAEFAGGKSRGGLSMPATASLCPRAELADLMLSTVIAYDAVCRLRQEPPMPMAKLSDREIQVLGWAANGKTSVEIATILSLSDHTVNSYLNSAMRKMDCVNRTQLVAKALRLHLIS